MADKPKRKMTEKQLANLKPFTKDDERAREAQKLSVEKQKQNRAERIKRSDGNEVVWDEFLGTKEQLQELWDSLSPKDKKDVLLKLLPSEIKQELNGSLGTKTVFITPEEHKETLAHIQEVINEQ